MPTQRNPREIALRVLSAYLTAGGMTPPPNRGAMPAPPRGTVGGVAFPRTGRPRIGTPPIMAPPPGSPWPWPAPLPAIPHAPAPARGRPSAMDVIARFVEASRARGGRR